MIVAASYQRAANETVNRFGVGRAPNGNRRSRSAADVYPNPPGVAGPRIWTGVCARRTCNPISPQRCPRLGRREYRSRKPLMCWSLMSDLPIAPVDTLLAIKTILLAPRFSPSERRVFGALVEHFSRETGQCDPSVPRLAGLL